MQQPLKTSRSWNIIFCLFNASKEYVICQSIFRTEYFLPSARSMRSIQSIFTRICLATLINLCFRDEFFQIISIFENRLKAAVWKNKRKSLIPKKFHFLSFRNKTYPHCFDGDEVLKEKFLKNASLFQRVFSKRVFISP